MFFYFLLTTAMIYDGLLDIIKDILAMPTELSNKLTWYKNNKKHNINGPAGIGYYENGNKRYEIWIENNTFHNLNGPAWIDYYENGNKKYEEWYQNYERHNLNGPAWIDYYEGTNGNNGNKKSEGWYENGKHIKTKEYKEN